MAVQSARSLGQRSRPFVAADGKRRSAEQVAADSPSLRSDGRLAIGRRLNNLPHTERTWWRGGGGDRLGRGQTTKGDRLSHWEG